MFPSSEPRSPRGRRAGALRRGRDGAARRELEGGRAAGAGGGSGAWGTESEQKGAEPKGGGSGHREGHLGTETDRATPPGQTQTGTGPGQPGPALLLSPSSRTGTPLLLRGQTPFSAVPRGPSVCWHRLGEIQCPQTIVSPKFPHAASLFHN